MRWEGKMVDLRLTLGTFGGELILRSESDVRVAHAGCRSIYLGKV